MHAPQKPTNVGEFDQVLQHVQVIIENPQQRKELLESIGDNAQEWLDLFQLLVEYLNIAAKLRSWIFKIMISLSRRSGRHPQCLIIQEVEKLGQDPVGGGAFGDVWKGRVGQQIVCLKVIRAFEASDVQQILKDYMQEAIIWRQLNHQNLLPFMGIYYLDSGQKRLCLVSPWMEQGNLVQYLKNTAAEAVNHDSLAYDVACGLSYLHEANIVHGDLKGVNILITPELRACIGDFGLSRVSSTQLLLSETSRSNGTTRWLSPELLIPGPNCLPSSQSDVYAYACVCYEIYTGRVPFYEMPEATIVLAIVINKKRPSRPENCIKLHDWVWDMMIECWNEAPTSRPTMVKILGRMVEMKDNRQLELPSEWKDPAFTHIWNDPQLPPVIRAVRSTPLLDHNTHLPGQSQLHITPTSSGSIHLPGPLSSGNVSYPGLGGTGGGERLRREGLYDSGETRLRGFQTGQESYSFRESDRGGNSMKKRKQVHATEQRATKRTRHEDSAIPSTSNAIIPPPSVPSPSSYLYGAPNSQMMGARPPQPHPLMSDLQSPFAEGHPQPTGEVLSNDVAIIPTRTGRFPENIQDISSFPPEFIKEGHDWFAIFNPESKKGLDVGLVHTLEHESVVFCVRFSPDGTCLATGCNPTAQIYDVKTGVKICVLVDEPTGDRRIRSVCFSPDGKFLATGSEDHQIRLWDIARKQIRYIFDGHQDEVYSVDFSSDGRMLLSASGDNTVRIWSMMDGASKVFTGDSVSRDPGLSSAAMSPNGHYVAAGGFDTVVRIWNINTGQLLRRLRGHQDCVYSVVFTPDSLGLVSGSLDKTSKYWDLDLSALMMNGAFSQTEVQPSGSDGFGALVNRSEGKQNQFTKTFTGHEDYVLCVVVSHDGRWLVSGSKDCRVQFIDLEHGTVQCVLGGHKNSVTSVDLSRTGNMLATGGGDRVARIWSYKMDSID